MSGMRLQPVLKSPDGLKHLLLIGIYSFYLRPYGDRLFELFCGEKLVDDTLFEFFPNQIFTEFTKSKNSTGVLHNKGHVHYQW